MEPSKAAGKNKYINKVSENFELLVDSWLRTIVVLVVFTIVFITFLVVPILGYVSEVSPFRDSVVFSPTKNLILWIELLSAFYGTFTVVMAYLSGNLVQFTVKASRRYRKRKLSSQKASKERETPHAEDGVE